MTTISEAQAAQRALRLRPVGNNTGSGQLHRAWVEPSKHNGPLTTICGKRITRAYVYQGEPLPKDDPWTDCPKCWKGDETWVDR